MCVVTSDSGPISTSDCPPVPPMLIVLAGISDVPCLWDGGVCMGQERRCKERFDLFLPITVSVNDSEVAAVTRSVSSGGVYFYTQGTLHEGNTVEFRLTLPDVLTQAGDLPVLCQGRVLRIDSHAKEGLSGVAVRVDSMVFLESLTASVDRIQPSAQA